MSNEKNEQLSKVKSLIKEIDILKDKSKNIKDEDLYWKRKELIYSYVFYLISKDKDLNE